VLIEIGGRLLAGVDVDVDIEVEFVGVDVVAPVVWVFDVVCEEEDWALVVVATSTGVYSR
jgi:hypothetical protein